MMPDINSSSFPLLFISFTFICTVQLVMTTLNYRREESRQVLSEPHMKATHKEIQSLAQDFFEGFSSNSSSVLPWMVMRLVKRELILLFCLNFDFSYDFYFCNLKTREFSFIKTKERIHSSSVKTLGQRGRSHVLYHPLLR